MNLGLDRFLAAACGKPGNGSLKAAREMLADGTTWADSNIFAAGVLGRTEAVARLLAGVPALARARGGPFDWEPLLYVCFSRLSADEPDRMGAAARTAQLLLDHGADPDTHHLLGRSRLTALFAAAAVHGNPELTRVLLEAGAEPNDGESMFHAAERGHFDCLEIILQRGGDLNDTRRPAGNTPLHGLLDWRFNRPAVEWVLARGADPNVRVGQSGETALHVAVRRRRLEMIDPLLSSGAEIDARTAGGKTAYAHACRRGFDEVAKLLAERGAATQLAAADELAAALMRNDLTAARARIDADPELVPGFGPEEARVLPDVAGYDRAGAIELLLDAGADIAARGLDGGTALHQAAWFGAPPAARLLIDRGAPLHICGDDHDSTPLGWTAHGSRYSGGAAERVEVYARIAEMLLAARASLANPADPAGDPHGRWLFRDASEAVGEVLRRHGGRPD